MLNQLCFKLAKNITKDIFTYKKFEERLTRECCCSLSLNSEINWEVNGEVDCEVEWELVAKLKINLKFHLWPVVMVEGNTGNYQNKNKTNKL